MCRKSGMAIKTQWITDTVYIKEIVRDTVLIPKEIYVARVDTVVINIPYESLAPDNPIAADTTSGMLSGNKEFNVLLPVERKVYETNFYRAVIEGYKPELLEMSVFPETKYVTSTEIRTVKKKTRLGVGLQAGYGVTGDKLKPYVGVGVQYNIISF